MAPDFASGSALTQLYAAFSAGVGTSLTPCIYPLIPITLAIFGASKETNRIRSFLLALCYVLGIATTYTVLGIVAAKTGGIFGSFLSNPWTIALLSILLTALALYSLDAFKIGAVAKLQQTASHVGGQGFRGAYMMGTVSGFVAAPCAAPMLVLILGVAAAQQNTAWGAALLFTYAMGMGMLFLVLGLFPLLLNRLPRSGNWLHAVKFLMAGLLLMVVLFISQPFHVHILGPMLHRAQWLPLVLCAASVAIAVIGYRLPNAFVKSLAGFGFAISVFYLLVVPAAPAGGAKAAWSASIEAGLQSAKERSTIVMADLYADWCAACKELDEKTFSNEAVRKRLEEYSLVRIDFTLDSESNSKLSDQYAVAGLPCLLFLTPDGKEVPNSRITGFLEPEAFLKHLNSLKN